ncbi:MAG: CYTH and CHAD domain-containing protein [Acidimicrobiales bacterium]
MTSPIERELKLDVGPDFHLPDVTTVPGLSMVTKPEKTLVASYYDTSGLDLARWGATLRYRASGASGEWTVKLDPPGSGGRGGERAPADAAATTDRYEIEFEAGPGRVPRRALELTNGLRRGRPLAVVAELTTVRRAHLILDPDGLELAEMDDDTVEFVTRTDPVRTGAFREIEVELLTAPEGAGAAPSPGDGADGADRGAESGWTRSLYSLLSASGAKRNDGTPKLMRALGVVPPPLLASPPISDSATMSELVSATLEAALHRLLRHEVGVRLGGDVEDLHQCRVATRRLRAGLRGLEAVLDPEPVAAVVERLQVLGTALGEVRDADVLELSLRSLGPRLDPADRGHLEGLLGLLHRERTGAHERLVRRLGGPDHGRLVDSLFDLWENPPLRVPDKQAAETARRLVSDRWATLAEAVADLPDQPADEALHSIRKKAKRCRYAADMASPLLGKRASRLSKAAAEVQDILGEVQDAAVAAEWLRRSARSGGQGRALVAGQLIGMEAARAEAARQDWSRAWKKTSHQGRVKWLAPSS